MKNEVDGMVDRVMNAGPANLRSAIEELAKYALQRRSEPFQGSVLQDWVMRLPLREQGTLLTSVRGCDDEAKTWERTGVAFSAGRRLTAFIRWCFMNPADVREVDFEEGSFFMSSPSLPFRPSAFGHLPLHWYTHAMHALEIIAYRHPDVKTQEVTYYLYAMMVTSLHLNVETEEQMAERLSEDRIQKGSVVS